ncbi:hypothetical protein [Actinomycetospora aeridis]|uniref:Uncharacterized protein n=1 Tax=Actinomycetospora aeridis TaxID=3129231 RepID=A0ABU8NED0_9PSEU
MIRHLGAVAASRALSAIEPGRRLHRRSGTVALGRDPDEAR